MQNKFVGSYRKPQTCWNAEAEAPKTTFDLAPLARGVFRIRLSLLMTHRQLGELAGVDARSVAAFESGSDEVGIEVAQRICAVFGIELQAA